MIQYVKRWCAIGLYVMSPSGCALGTGNDAGDPIGVQATPLRNCDAKENCPQVPEEDSSPRPPVIRQPQPPSPYGTPNQFDFGVFAFGVDAAIIQKLNAPLPTDNVPWPLANPYTREVSGAPVRVQSIDANLWAFTSYDAGGLASTCVGKCTGVPALLFNPNYGTYQATLVVSPRLDVEFWEVIETTSKLGIITRSAHRVAEVTATVKMRAFAECIGWENGSGRLHALGGPDDVTIARDTGFLEDVANVFVPGFSASKNRQIRDKLRVAMGVGHFAALPIDGDPCATLGVSGDASTGSILWNATKAVSRPQKIR